MKDYLVDALVRNQTILGKNSERKFLEIHRQIPKLYYEKGVNG
jgi:hypothetical protein